MRFASACGSGRAAPGPAPAPSSAPSSEIVAPMIEPSAREEGKLLAGWPRDPPPALGSRHPHLLAPAVNIPLLVGHLGERPLVQDQRHPRLGPRRRLAPHQAQLAQLHPADAEAVDLAQPLVE